MIDGIEHVDADTSPVESGGCCNHVKVKVSIDVISLPRFSPRKGENARVRHG